MNHYTYVARDAQGQTHQGAVEAVSREEAVRKVKAGRLFPLEVKATSRPRGRRPGVEHVIRFYSDLADLLNAGLPLDRALAMIITTQTHSGMQQIVKDVFEEVQGGGELSKAVEKRTQVFGDLAPHLIRAGESTGTLAVVVAKLAELAERRRRFMQGLVSALIYPCILMAMSLLSIVVLLVWVIPKFAGVFASLQQKVPPATQFLLDLGSLLQDFGFLVPVLGLLAYVGARLALRNPENRLKKDRLVLKIPVLGRLIVTREISRFCGTLGTMLQGGVPMLKALALTEKTVGNGGVREVLAPLKSTIKAGGTMSDFFKKLPLFPPRLGSMLRIGEEQGNAGGVLLGLGNYFEQEFESAMKRFMAFLEPGVIILTGLLIGVMVMSMFSAIFGINDIQF